MSNLPPTRDRLVAAAALLFQRKGYHGVGVAEILEASEAPKGSLYHHFPNGKSDLALAAAHFAAQETLRILDASFEDANTARDGITTFCYKLAKLFTLHDNWSGCPISSTLFESPSNQEFRLNTREIFQEWHEATKAHAIAKGAEPENADAMANALWMTLQGAWTMSRVRGTSDPIKQVPMLIFGS
ncbi:TetR/AcrR family transcriptional regulator [uncultured Litoreibacter sp.]|uniref:TetR/AcrR family transcriptional regulator n=1 Tax=uncultured Litoreibacter sp. TaxID=1392394 RepID=UPI00261A8E11|nr:TetR/AcrR family transcriptional regulator [uncultured Litoreibacter sp.]